MNRHRLARAAGALAAPMILYLFPQAVLAHQLKERYEAPLPLVAYVAGAALAVAMSFLFVMVRKARRQRRQRTPAPQIGPTAPCARAGFVMGLQALGMVAWLWIVVQTFVGGNGDGDVASLFLWVYGWVGVALISAVLGPVWPWLNPFATIHQLLSAPSRPARHQRRRAGRVPGASGSLAGDRRLPRRRLAGARLPHRGRSATGPVHDRLHVRQRRGDGLLRPRDVAGQRRDVQRLVRRARPAWRHSRSSGRRVGR